MANGRIIEYVYVLPKLYQIKSEVAPGMYRVQGCIFGHRKVASEDVLSPANIKLRTNISPTQLIGLRKEPEFFKMKNEALEEQLNSAEVYINVGFKNLRSI